MKKSITFLLVLCSCIGLLACGNDPVQSPNTKAATAPTVETTSPTKTVVPTESQTPETDNATEPSTETSESIQTGLKDATNVKKIDTVDLNFTSITDAGAVYTGENGLKGIYYDSANMTEPKYVSCQSNGTLDSQWNGYFKVSATPSSEVTTITKMNQYGIVAGGKEVVPMEYAYIKHLNDRYFYVCKVTGQTANRDEALLYGSNLPFQFPFTSAQEDDPLFTGNWYIYDTVAQKLVPGATGSKPTSTAAYGNILMYCTDSDKQVYCNELGVDLPDGITVFDNGYYCLKKDNPGALYDSNQNLVFDCTQDGFILYGNTGEYLVARKQTEYIYVLMDLSGQIVSAEFSHAPCVYGSLLLVDHKLYDFDGNAVIDIECKSVSLDTQWNNAWIIKHNVGDTETTTIINKDGDVLYQGTDKIYYVTPERSVDGSEQTLFYSYTAQDFVITGDSENRHWLVSARVSQTECDLIDTVSGETILRDYANYQFVAQSGKAIYVYARNTDYTYDIYIIE